MDSVSCKFESDQDAVYAKKLMNQTASWVGIDVSKAQLDGHIRPTTEMLQVANTEAGIAALVQRTLVVMAATAV